MRSYPVGQVELLDVEPLDFSEFLRAREIPFIIAFTKADKLSKGKAAQNAKAWMDKLLDVWEELPPYFITSSDEGTGRDEVLGYIEKINAQLAIDNR